MPVKVPKVVLLKQNTVGPERIAKSAEGGGDTGSPAVEPQSSGSDIASNQDDDVSEDQSVVELTPQKESEEAAGG